MDLDLNGQKLFNYRKEDINISESIQFKKIPTKESKTNSNIDISPEKLNIPAQIQKEKIRQIEEQDKIFNYIKETQFVIDSKTYSNSIIIGSFCYAITFISFGIFKSRIVSDEYTNIWSVLATYGGLGQITAGILELNKKRQFTSFLYIIYGIYCLTHYLLRILTDRFGEYDLCMFFLAFFLLSVPAIIFSIKINLFFLLQTSLGSLYFLMRCIGEGIFEDILSEQVSGSIQIASGVCSFYIFIYQIYNSFDFRICLPIIPFDVNNGIDFIIQKNVDKSHSN
jgi:succinate-acetate transporter protein